MIPESELESKPGLLVFELESESESESHDAGIASESESDPEFLGNTGIRIGVTCYWNRNWNRNRNWNQNWNRNWNHGFQQTLESESESALVESNWNRNHWYQIHLQLWSIVRPLCPWYLYVKSMQMKSEAYHLTQGILSLFEENKAYYSSLANPSFQY